MLTNQTQTFKYTYIYEAALAGDLTELKKMHLSGCLMTCVTPIFAAGNGHLECFKYCFEINNDPQHFWKNINYELYAIIDKIDLDDPVWRRLFTLDLCTYPQLQSKVNAKKQEIEEIKAASKDALQNTLPMDVIKYCLQPFF
jgi:hypothetical protein